MRNTSIKDDIIARLEGLPRDLQHRVLEFAKSLSPQGVEGKSLLRFEGTIPDDDLRLMSKAIEDTCEKVDISEW